MWQTNISKGIPKALLFAVTEVHKNILNKQKPGVTSELCKSHHALPLTSFAVLSLIDWIESNPNWEHPTAATVLAKLYSLK